MLKNSGIWLPTYFKNALRREKRRCVAGPTHIFFCLVDHCEPLWNGATESQGSKRLERWVREYPRIAGRFQDSDGCRPKHTFFFACEEYRPVFFKRLREICAAGLAEVEMHLHHRRDSAQNLNKTLVRYRDLLADNGFLGRDRTGRIGYGFIHGNWALDNSLPDGDWCGVDNELQILRETGCYADFTLPSAPSPAQTRKINAVYYAADNPVKPKSHDGGVDVETGRSASGDLMIIQGPLALDWQRRKWGIFPRIENGALTGVDPPTPERVDGWVSRRISVRGRPDWIFVKVYTHGCQEKNAEALLGKPASVMYRRLQEKYNDGRQYRLHYVSARELYNIIKAAESGADRPEAGIRDHVFARPRA